MKCTSGTNGQKLIVCKNCNFVLNDPKCQGIEGVSKILRYETIDNSQVKHFGVRYDVYLSQNRRTLSLINIMGVDKAEMFAKAGFFYIESLNLIQCVFCLVTVNPNKCNGNKFNPMKKHKKINPCCPFIVNLPVGNIVPRFEKEEDIPDDQDLCGPFDFFDFVNIKSKLGK